MSTTNQPFPSSNDDDLDLILLIALLSSTCLALGEMSLRLRLIEKKDRQRQQSSKRFKRWYARENSNQEAVLIARWSSILASTSDRIFRRKFRMTKETFQHLCDDIRNKVGDEFIVEAQCSNFQASGEVRVAIGLRIMAGASYLDMVGVTGYGYGSTQTIYNIFHTFVAWINRTYRFPLSQLLEEINSGNDERAGSALAELHFISESFGESSGGIFTGCFGALDGLAVRIECPSMKSVPDPGTYFCRKNFYALNVQAICSKSKSFLWFSSGHKGSTHDSLAFRDTALYESLNAAEDRLTAEGLFLVGDSAYPLMGYMLVPIEGIKPLSEEDSFNFWLSNSRIQIECAFGELIMRWGIFWRPLRMNLKQNGGIISAAMLLHNFLVAKRDKDDIHYFTTFAAHTVDEIRNPSTSTEDDDVICFVSDNEAPRPAGRKTNDMKASASKGEILRRHLTFALGDEGKHRPLQSNMKVNAYGNIYFDG